MKRETNDGRLKREGRALENKKREKEEKKKLNWKAQGRGREKLLMQG